MCKIHRIHYSINTLKNSVNKITECIVIVKKIGKCNCMRFFFFVGYIRGRMVASMAELSSISYNSYAYVRMSWIMSTTWYQYMHQNAS